MVALLFFGKGFRFSWDEDKDILRVTSGNGSLVWLECNRGLHCCFLKKGFE